MTVTIGLLLVALAALPALAPMVETGVTVTVGLLMVALAGLSMAMDFGAHRRELLLWSGVILVCAGMLAQWRKAGWRWVRHDDAYRGR